jgi:hypothetical protein
MAEPAIMYMANQENVSVWELATLCAVGPIVGFITFKLVAFAIVKYCGGIIPFFVHRKRSKK